MEWPELLSSDRLGRDGKGGAHDPARSAFRRDSDRITFSTSFRRLQDKTQVFPLADNDHVRTRLTHTLEVASVGRSLGARVGGVICQRHKLEGVHASDFGDVVSAAALAHDLGNPPFGHSGEDAIRHWFKTSEHARQAATDFSQGQRSDIERYEGNAQGFRLITRLQMPDNPGGLQLTYATLGAFTKYPAASHGCGGPACGASGKKFGFFQSECAHFEQVAKHCHLIRRSAQPWWARHPLAFLVEAADDICYRLIDFEDGFRLGHLSYDEVSAAFLGLIEDAKRPRRLSEAHSNIRRIQILRDLAIGNAIEECTGVFLDHEQEILAGAFDQPLIATVESRTHWKRIEERSVESIYATARGVEIEAAGFEVLGGLLDIFVAAGTDLATRGAEASTRSRKLLQLLPAETRRPETDGYLRLLKMLDFVSGMTDRYAVTFYKKLRGISLPGQ